MALRPRAETTGPDVPKRTMIHDQSPCWETAHGEARLTELQCLSVGYLKALVPRLSVPSPTITATADAAMSELVPNLAQLQA